MSLGCLSETGFRGPMEFGGSAKGLKIWGGCRQDVVFIFVLYIYISIVYKFERPIKIYIYIYSKYIGLFTVDIL